LVVYDIHFILALLIFTATYGAIVFRNIKGVGVPVWSVMLMGAVGMVFSGSIGVAEAYRAINLEVLTFLFSMFIFVTAMDVSGVLEAFATRLFLRAKKPEDIIYLTFFGFSFASAVLMNDTLALMGTPIMLSLARKMHISHKPLLLTLAFSVTIGSVLTPMGNPQNLLVALVSGMPAPVITFLIYLTVPTIINLIITYFILKYLFRSEFRKANESFIDLVDFEASTKDSKITDNNLAKQTVLILVLTVAGIVFVNILEFSGMNLPFGISEVSLLGATLLLLFNKRRREIVKKLDFGILIMFAALFILMQALWNTGVVSEIAKYLPALRKGDSSSILSILVISVLLSQVLSNVPLVALYLPLMKNLGFGSADKTAWVALAGGSTLAGNLTLLGAASNLIIIEESEIRGHKLSFFEFFKVGWMVTAVNILILYIFLILTP
jgi:Na+/H+ antiporter NhaD/arsenite permease-like protein